MTIFSHSKLSTFEQCPKKYEFQYIKKIPRKSETIHLFLGKRVHETLERIYNLKKQGETPELKEILSFLKKIWNIKWHNEIKIFEKDKNKEDYFKIASRFVADFYIRNYPFNQNVIKTETAEIIDLDEQGKYKYHIRIDRLDSPEPGVYEIHDYKTNNNPRSQQELDEDRQLALYEYGIRKIYPDAKKINLIWHFLSCNQKLKSTRTEKQLEELRIKTLELIKKIEATKEFKTNISKLCDYCEYKEICPAFNQKIKYQQSSQVKLSNFKTIAEKTKI